MRKGWPESDDDAGGAVLQLVGPDVGAGDGELVAAQPGDQVAVGHRPLHAPGADHEGVIADVVAEPVVHRLEPVEVDVEHAVGSAGGRQLGQVGEEPAAVEQAREGVVVGQVLEPALRSRGGRGRG